MSLILQLPLLGVGKMVKNKRDLKSPRRNRSFTGSRPSTRGRLSPGDSRGNIRVIIRVRPPNNKESGDNSRIVTKVLNQHTVIFDPKEESEHFFFHGVQQRNRDIMKKPNKHLQFTFDRVFDCNTNNNDVFEASTKELIQTLMKGYNCSVFVYGATGAGKTHTMLGQEDDPGITVLTMRELFKHTELLSDERDFELGITYLEVYNENVQDLLNPGPALHLREDGKFGVIVAGIQLHRIEEPEALFNLLEQGSRNRTQHPTDANAESSRSHAVFQVYLRMKFKATGEILAAKLSMIDLAGSERGAATGYSGARFTEGANINKSLLALGNCINSLAGGQKHIPYRDSKLTRLLKDSLGGNCQTVMIANVSPSSLSYEDTYNTLKYALRAKKIKSTVKKNVVNRDLHIDNYIKLIDELRKENEELKLQLSSSRKMCTCKETIVSSNENNETLQKELQTLYNDKRGLEERIQQLESTEKLMFIRKQLKEESDARLSGICTNTPDKERGHRRLGNAVSCLERQAANLQQDITILKQRNEQFEMRIKDFHEKAPQLKSFIEIENAQIAHLKANNQIEHLKKVCDLQSREIKTQNNLLEKFSGVLKPCFLQLRGHGYATEDLIAKYNDIVKHLQGIRSVTWDEALLLDYHPVIQTDNIEQNEENQNYLKPQDAENQKHLNRTFEIDTDQPTEDVKLENEDPNAIAFNSTFKVDPEILSNIPTSISLPSKVASPIISSNRSGVITQNKRKLVAAKHLMVKVSKPSCNYKSSPASQVNKENKSPFRLHPKANNINPKATSLQEKWKSKNIVKPCTPSTSQKYIRLRETILQ